MAHINRELLRKIEKKLGVSQRQAYKRITAKANGLFLPRPQAAIALAADLGIGISRYATEQDLHVIRQAGISRGAFPEVKPVIVPDPKVVTKPGSGRRQRRAKTERTRRGKSVFVVHGRNAALRRSLFRFLRSVGLNPIEWRKAISLTGKPSPFIAEILDAAFREAVAAVVLFTPDDLARLRGELIKKADPQYERKLTPQPRPNVLFEAGMAMGRNPDATVLVQVGEVRPFSDIAGRHIVNLSNSTESRHELVLKLANAGCNIDTSGTDWLTEGDFSG